MYKLGREKIHYINREGSRNLSEEKILQGIATGDESAFRQVFDLYYQLLVTFAYRYIGDLDSSRNVVQDVFVGLFDKRETIVIHTSLKAHLYQSVRNRALNFLKREKMQRDHHYRILEEKGGEEIYDEPYGVGELEAHIGRVVNNLPAQCRKIFLLSRQEGLPNGEIAEQLSISKRTVETQISKALKRIREELLKNGLLPIWICIALLLGS